MKSVLRALDRYWFPHGSPTTLGLFRILIGSLAFLNMLMVGLGFDAWFTERGFVPWRATEIWMGSLDRGFTIFGIRGAFPFQVPRIDLLHGVTTEWVTAAFYVAVTIAALLTALGLWTRFSSIAFAIGIVSIHHRNPIILHGGDTALRVCALYLALAPAGAACSLDRIIGLWKGRIAPGPVSSPLWVQRLIAFNVAVVYLTTVWHKWGGDMWRFWPWTEKSLTATWYPARLNEFERFPYPDFIRSMPVVYATTLGTLLIEFALGTLVFYRPFRKWVLLGGVLLHAWIEYSMNIPLFSFLMVSMYIAFYSGEEVESWARRQGERLARLRARVLLPAGRRLKPGPEAALNAMDPLDLVAYDEGSAPTLTARDARDRALNPYRSSMIRSVGAAPIWPIPGLWRRLIAAAMETEPLASPTAVAPRNKETARRGA